MKRARGNGNNQDKQMQGGNEDDDDDDDHQHGKKVMVGEENANLRVENVYRWRLPDFEAMPTLETRGGRLDFGDPAALLSLTRALLEEDFGLKMPAFPLHHLCPTLTSRLEYLLFVHELLLPRLKGLQRVRVDTETLHYDAATIGLEKHVRGVDLGCGSSCIYPLLGARLFGWSWIASELDVESVECARANVRANGLEAQIHVVQVKSPQAALCSAIDLLDRKGETLTFTVCNPPFFEDASEAAQNPHRNTAITNSEAATDGGEVAFISRIIADSLLLKESSTIEWFTSLCGKKSSLGPLKTLLHQNQVPLVISERLRVGKTHRWVLAWSFRICDQDVKEGPFKITGKSSGSYATRRPRALFDSVLQYLRDTLLLTIHKCDARTLQIACELTSVLQWSVEFLFVEKPDQWLMQIKRSGGDMEMHEALLEKLESDLEIQKWR